MKLYNESTDTIATSIKAFYKRGFVDHYKAIDMETGKRIKIGKEELKRDWQDARYVDIDAIRGDENMDDFMRDTM